jgi:hypothetical protein
MSTGTKYYINKYKLAHDDVAKPDSKACECEVKAIEELMAAPYKTFRATKTARKDLKDLRDVTEKDADVFEEFLVKTREELKNKEGGEKQTAENGAHECKDRQRSPKPKIILHVKNSPLRRSQSAGSGSGSTTSASDSINNDGANDCKGKQTSPKPRIILNVPNSPLRRKRSSSSSTSGSNAKGAQNEQVKPPSPRIILNVPNSPLRRKRSSSSSTSRLNANGAQTGQVKPPSPRIILNVPNSPLRRTQSPVEIAAVPVTQTNTTSNGTAKPPSPRIKLNVSNSTLRRSQSPKIGQPRQSPVRIRLRINNLSTQAWEKVSESVEETPAPTQAPAQQQQEQNPRKRKNESLFDLESAAKRQHSELCKPGPIHEISKPFIADHYKYVNHKPTSIWDGITIHEDISTKQMVTRNMTKKGAAKRGEPEKRRKVLLQPPKKDDPLRFGTSEFIRDQEIADDLEAIKARKEEQIKFRDLREKMKAMARHYNSEEAPNHQIYNKMKVEQAKKEAEAEKNQLDGYQAKKGFGQVKAKCEQEVELVHQEPAKNVFEANDHMILDDPMDLGIFQTEKKAMKAYKEAEKCAHLAKQTVEAKQKLVAIARELETIDKQIGPDPNGPQLSAIPTHIRMLMVPAKTKKGRTLTEFEIRTNGEFPSKYINTTPRKPSNLRHELGASLAEKEAAETAKQKAEEEEKQRQELQAEQNRIRQQNAQKTLDKFLDTGAMPEISNENDLNDFQQALNLWFETDEGKRQREGEEYAERIAREQAAADSQAHFGGVAMQRVPTDEGYSSMRSAPVREEEDKMECVEMADINDCPAVRKP